MLLMKSVGCLLFFSLWCCAQQPNCQINFGPWNDTNVSPPFNNVAAGNNNQCTYWVLNYQVDGFSAISLQFESATGAVVPGTFGAFSGTVTSGVNPSVSVACSTVTNCTATFTGAVGWYRINFPSHTGSGTIRGTVKGFVAGVPLGGASPPGGTACPGTAVTPCVVDGVTAAGSPPTTPPVLVAGQDGAPGNLRTLQTDTAGRQIEVGAAAVGAAVAGNPVLQGWSDGTNAQNAFFCTNQAAITLTAGTDVVIVAGTAAKKTIVCHIDFVANAAQTFTIREGTGATCGTGTATVAGAYPNTITFAADYGATGALRTATAADDLCLHSGVAVTAGGVVVYAQF